MDEELELLIKHSRVLAGEDIGELKESDDIINNFNGISLKNILESKETFEPFERLIHTLNAFFKYDVDLYPQLLDFLVKNYVLKLQHNDITLSMAIHPVMDGIKKIINNEGLYDYIFTGNTTNLTPSSIFVSTDILSTSIKHFEEEEFTSKVVAEGLSSITYDIDEMFNHPEYYPFDVVYEDIVMAAIDKDNVALLNYLVTKHEDKKPMSNIILTLISSFMCRLCGHGWPSRLP